jgi:hypothetical protein
MAAGVGGFFFCTSAASAVSIDWVTVGDAGNAADITGYGAVAEEYRIGKFEVSNAESCRFVMPGPSGLLIV